MFFGTALVAWMTSEMTLAVTQLAASDTELLAQRQTAEKFMATARLPPSLRMEIRDFYDRVAASGRGEEARARASDARAEGDRRRTRWR